MRRFIMTFGGAMLIFLGGFTLGQFAKQEKLPGKPSVFENDDDLDRNWIYQQAHEKEAGSFLESIKKTTEPHAYRVQLRSFIRQYGDTKYEDEARKLLAKSMNEMKEPYPLP